MGTFSLTKKKRVIANDLPILYISNFEIVKNGITKFLGIFVEEILIWKHHIEHVCNKISKSIGVMYKSGNILRKRVMKQMYFLFIHS